MANAEHGPRARAGRAGALRVAAGILTSRVFGLVRDSLVARLIGLGPLTDVYSVAFRGPNLLQNLLGEGTLSAAFIPLYSRMLAEERVEDAGRFAGAIFGLLLVVAATLSLVGVLAAPAIVALVAPGFLGDGAAAGSIDRYALTVTAVRYVFPMAGVLVLSAWALGVLNSHRRLFLSYVAPAAWNAAIIAALLVACQSGGYAFFESLAGQAHGAAYVLAACVGALLGGVLQLLVQLPTVLRLLGGLRVRVSLRVAGVREAMRAAGPVILARGGVQLGSWFDTVLASLLVAGAPGAQRFATILYVLPVSLFGMSVAAAELPELSRESGEGQREAWSERLGLAQRQVAFLVVPTVVGYLCFGLPITSALFGAGVGGLVALVLAAYAPGLIASTWSRPLQNGFYALGDTKTPARVALARIALSALLSVPLMLFADRFRLDELVGLPLGETGALHLGAIGIAGASALGAWVELLALSLTLRRRVGGFALPWDRLVRFLALAVLLTVPAALVWRFLSGLWEPALAAAVVAVFAGLYLGAARVLRWRELGLWLGRVGAS